MKLFCSECGKEIERQYRSHHYLTDNEMVRRKTCSPECNRERKRKYSLERRRLAREARGAPKPRLTRGRAVPKPKPAAPPPPPPKTPINADELLEKLRAACIQHPDLLHYLGYDNPAHHRTWVDDDVDRRPIAIRPTRRLYA